MSMPEELEKLGIVYCLTSPVSGPAFERLVLRIRYNERREIERLERLALRSKSDDELIRVAGSFSEQKEKGADVFHGLYRISSADLKNMNFSEAGEGKKTPLIFVGRQNSKEMSAETEFNDRDIRFGTPFGSDNEIIGHLTDGGSNRGAGAELESFHDDAMSLHEKQTLLMQAVDFAMARLKKLTSNSRLANSDVSPNLVNCLIVNVHGMTGYLVCCSVENKTKIENIALQSLGNDISEFLRERGVLTHFNKFFPVELQTSVPTREWWKTKTDFIKTTEWNGTELMAAFFRFDRTVVDIHPVANKKYMGVEVAEVDAEHTVGFNLYLYLPLNKRYFLYTRKGRMLLERQKLRLIRKGVKDLCVLIEEIPELIKFRARVFLSNNLRDYERDQMIDC